MTSVGEAVRLLAWAARRPVTLLWLTPERLGTLTEQAHSNIDAVAVLLRDHIDDEGPTQVPEVKPRQPGDVSDPEMAAFLRECGHTVAPVDPTDELIREWAREQGHRLPVDGSIPVMVRDAYAVRDVPTLPEVTPTPAPRLQAVDDIYAVPPKPFLDRLASELGRVVTDDPDVVIEKALRLVEEARKGA